MACEQDVTLAAGALSEIANILDRRRVRRVLLVLDENAYAASGAAAVLEPTLRTLDVTRFTDFESNPKIEDVARGVERFAVSPPDLVVALGGGSAIDIAKLLAAMGPQTEDVIELATGKAAITRDGVPLVAIPTTAGTGSEATHFAVVYVDGEKYSVAHPSILPKYALVDPELTYQLPPKITASSGLDAFCQAVESIWAVGSTEESLGYAAEAVRICVAHLVAATNRPTPAARNGMSRAAYLAGKAINISKTTLPHAVSYALTSDYGALHGMAVATTLSATLAFNAQVTSRNCTDPRGAEHVQDRIALILKLLEASSVSIACKKIEQLLRSLRCPTTVAELGVDDLRRCRQIARQVNLERLLNNPRQVDEEDLVAMLSESISPEK